MFDLFKIECESLTGRYFHFWPSVGPPNKVIIRACGALRARG
jgi:hypothetical protein